MDFNSLLKPESVILGLQKGSKKEIIRRLVAALPIADGENGRDEILNAVMQRESVMSTGIGRGVAIPHAKTERVEGIMVSVGIAEKPIPFDAVDDQPCRIFILVVSDPNATSPHVRVLSHISRILNDPVQKLALETAATVEEVIAALTSA
jgi:mannitol/fructose-specific phosphotransferase system IIA component (Ntr-type)